MYASMPAAAPSALSSSEAHAVSAAIKARRPPCAASRARMRRVASRPSHTGICTSCSACGGHGCHFGVMCSRRANQHCSLGWRSPCSTASGWGSLSQSKVERTGNAFLQVLDYKKLSAQAHLALRLRCAAASDEQKGYDPLHCCGWTRHENDVEGRLGSSLRRLLSVHGDLLHWDAQALEDRHGHLRVRAARFGARNRPPPAAALIVTHPRGPVPPTRAAS